MKTKIKRISKSSLSIILAITMVLSMSLVGMISTNASNSTKRNFTVYFAANSTYYNYVKDDGYVIKVFTKHNADGSYSTSSAMLDTGKTYTYSGTNYHVFMINDAADWYDGLTYLYFQVWNGSTWVTEKQVFTSWNSDSVYKGKLYCQASNSWVSYTSTFYRLHHNFSDSSNYSDVPIDTSNNVTFNLNAGTYEFKIVKNVNGTDTWYGNDGTYKRSNSGGVWSLSENTNNMKVETDIAGDYIFNLTSTDPKLSITYPANTYTVTRSITGSNYGTLKLNGSASDVTGLSGTNTITILATPKSNCRLKSLKVGDVEKLTKAQSTAYSSNVSVSAATTITATFESMPTYYLLGEKLNSWGTSYALTSTDGDTFTYTFDGTNATFPAGKFLVSSSESTSNNVKADAATSGNTGVTLSKDGNDLTFTYTSGYGCPVTVTYYESTKTVKLVASQENFTGLSINAKGTDDGTNYSVTVSPSTLTLSSSSGNSSTGVTATASTTAGDYKLTGFTATNGTVSNVNLTAGTCTFKPSANNASVTAKYGKVYTISTSSNNTGLGTVSAPASAGVGATVTVTSTEVGGTFSSAVVKQGTTTVKSSTSKVFSFTMPAGNVNVTATFAEYVGKSDYYYDGYSTSGSIVSGYDTKQLSEGKIGGNLFGYIKVSRSGTGDELFTVKKKESSTQTGYVYITNNYNYDNLKVHFWKDGYDYDTWPGTAMTNYDGNNWKVAIPDGATKFLITRNDNTNITGDMDLDGAWCAYYFSGDGSSPTLNNWDERPSDAGVQSGSTYTTYYWGDSVYKSDTNYGAAITIGEYNVGNTKYPKVNGQDEYYVIVYYPGVTYTVNGYEFTVPSDKPYVIAAGELPGVISNSVTIYAKDGSIRSGYQKFAEMADTKITGTGVTATSYDYYEKAKVEKGSSVTITTTINSGKRGKYYVRGFCVNGITYGPTTKAEALASHTSTGVYSFTLNIPSAETFSDKFGDVNALEITPVYFYLDSREVTTFYVKGYEGDVVKKWGNTLACYVYYSSGVESYSSSDDSLQNAFGGYPGQPMIYTGGRYMIEVPTYIDSGSKRVKGVTLNNYYHDDIHKSLGFATDNQQTYDYDDFDRIRTLNDKKDIIFTFKFKKTIDNPNSYATTGSGTTTFKGTSYYTNGFEYLYNAQGKKIDLFGNVIPSTSTASPVYVVSNGYENYNTTVGKYATSWSIYPSNASSGTARTAVMAPSVRFAADANSVASYYDNNEQGNVFKTAYTAVNNSNYLNHPVLITYEKALWNGDSNTTAAGDDQAQRSDGVWSYSKASDYISSNIKIEFGSSATGSFTTDTFTDTHVGTVTGCEAYFTNEAFYGAVTSPQQYADSEKNYELYAEADSDGTYMFLGWYLLSEGVYTKLDDWFVSATTSPMATSDTYVARFIQTPTGSVRFTHDLFKNAPTLNNMPTVHTGTGKTYIKVDVIDPDRDNAVVASYGNTSSAQSANVSSSYIAATSTYNLRVTLTTIPTGLNTFTKLYENDESHSEYTAITPSASTGTITTIRTIAITEMFDNNLQLKYNNVEYYSDITPVTRDYKVTFTYTDRFGDSKSYVKKGKLTETYVATHNSGTAASIYLDKAFIMSLAPYEDNFSEIIKWDDSAITNVTNSNTSQAISTTVNSLQTIQTVNVKYNTQYKTDGPLDGDENYDYGSLIMDGTTLKLKAPEVDPTDSTKKFSYWEIKNDHGVFVAKCYSRYFNYRLYDNYTIKPVYSTNPEKYNTSDVSTTIQFLEYSRNQWTDAEGTYSAETDKLYADFAVAFNKNGELITPSSNNCGIIFAIGDTLVYDDGSIDTDISDVDFSTNEDSLKAYIKDGTAYSKGSSATSTVKKLAINSLDNKNRIEVYGAFKNLTNNTYPVIKVYSYIVNGSDVILSTPIYINLYDTSVAAYK